MFGTNRALRATIAHLRSELDAARGNVAEAVGHRKELEAEYKAAIAKLDAELNGTPADYSMHSFAPRIYGMKDRLHQAEQRARWGAQMVENTSKELKRVQRHNAALREALTALGGAVIELQDHIEVNQ